MLSRSLKIWSAAGSAAINEDDFFIKYHQGYTEIRS
ncbi:hypothetical protein mEp515_23 [Escherichia phage mEp515]